MKIKKRVFIIPLLFIIGYFLFNWMWYRGFDQLEYNRTLKFFNKNGDKLNQLSMKILQFNSIVSCAKLNENCYELLVYDSLGECEIMYLNKDSTAILFTANERGIHFDKLGFDSLINSYYYSERDSIIEFTLINGTNVFFTNRKTKGFYKINENWTMKKRRR